MRPFDGEMVPMYGETFSFTKSQTTSRNGKKAIDESFRNVQFTLLIYFSVFIEIRFPVSHPKPTVSGGNNPVSLKYLLG